MMNSDISIPIIGYMQSPFIEKFGIPRQPNLVNSVSYIVMNTPYDDLDGFKGLEQFSHLWLLWQFHDNKRKNNSNDFQPLIRPPRLGGNQKIGVFASRSMYRPASIGLSVVQFLCVKRESNQTRVYVQGADLLNGTPIIDIKPYLAYADAIPEAMSGYAQQAPEMLQIIWQQQAQQDRQLLLSQHKVEQQLLTHLEQILALNPKPAYQQDQNKVYGLRYANLNVKFQISNDNVNILSLHYVGD